MLVRFRIVFYMIVGMLIQHLYNEFSGHSGGGFAALFFTVATLLDPGFTFIDIKDETIKHEHEVHEQHVLNKKENRK